MHDGKIQEITGPPQPTASFGTVQWLHAGALSLVVLSYTFFTAAIAAPIAYQTYSHPHIQGAVLSVALLSSAASTFVFIPISSRFGRKLPLLCSMVLIIVGSLVSGAAPALWPALLVGRLIGGFGGGSIVGALLLGHEIIPSSSLHDAMISLQSVGGAFGIFLAISMGTVDGRLLHDWRLSLLLPIIPSALAAALVIFFLPESPQYLLSVGREKAATAAIEGIAAGNEALCENMTFSSQHRSTEALESWRDLGKRKYRKPLIHAFLLRCLFQLSSLSYPVQFLVFSQKAVFGDYAGKNSDYVVLLALAIPHFITTIIISTCIRRLRNIAKSLYVYLHVSYGIVLLTTAVVFQLIQRHQSIPFVLVGMMSVISVLYSSIAVLLPMVSWNCLFPEIRDMTTALSTGFSSVISYIYCFTFYYFVARGKHLPTVFMIGFGISSLAALLAAVTSHYGFRESLIVEQLNAVHMLPVIPSDPSNDDTARATGLKHVKVPAPLSTP